MDHSKTILFMGVVGRAKLCIVLDIAIINDSVGLSQFLGARKTVPKWNFHGLYGANGLL